MEIVETANGIVVDSRDSWKSSIEIRGGGEICESVVGVEGSWQRGSNEWTKTAVS